MKNQTNSRYLDQLSAQESAQVAKMHQIVAESLREESLLSSRLCEDDTEKSTFGERLADRVATFGGSWRFIIIFGVILVTWIGLNTFVMNQKAFDPYPYILLNLLLSCIAALQAPVIMMSQNRKESKDRQRAENDYMINLKSEIEIRHLHQKIDLNIVDQYHQLLQIQKAQLELLEELRAEVKRLGSKTT